MLFPLAAVSCSQAEWCWETGRAVDGGGGQVGQRTRERGVKRRSGRMGGVEWGMGEVKERAGTQV